MKKKVFTVYDSKAEAYLQPFFMNSIGEAVRGFGDASEDPKTQFYAHPADFTLFLIGEYDEQNGILINNDANTSLGSALEHQSKARNETTINNETQLCGSPPS